MFTVTVVKETETRIHQEVKGKAHLLSNHRLKPDGRQSSRFCVAVVRPSTRSLSIRAVAEGEGGAGVSAHASGKAAVDFQWHE